MEDITKTKVYREQEAYNAIRDDLCKTEHAGKAVLFEGGEVVDFFETEGDAYIEGLRLFGQDGGFLIDRVAPQQVVFLPSVWSTDIVHSEGVLTVSKSDPDMDVWYYTTTTGCGWYTEDIPATFDPEMTISIPDPDTNG